MKITIDVPEVKCARCSATAPIQPHLLYLRGQAPPQLRELLSAVVKVPATTTASGGDGRDWAVLADDKPIGWVKGPSASDLCTACGTLWMEAGKAFMVPPPPPEPVVEVVPETKPEGEEEKVETKPEKLRHHGRSIGKPHIGSAHFPLVAPKPVSTPRR